MQTVRLNRAAVAASAAVLFLLLCVITYLPSSSQNPHVVRAIRPNPKFELRPVSKTFNTQAIFGGRGMPATIVDAADTLWIMGLRKEYEQARDYIKENFDMNKATGTLSVFETTIRFLGGLLSLFALTGEQFYMSLGALGDSFYEYLIKSWLQSGKTDEQARKMYWEVSKAMQEQMVMKSKSGLTYVAELRNGLPEHKMGHLACFSVGMFALQAVNEKTEEERLSTMKLAEELGRTCHESYIRTTTHIGPEMFYFNGEEDATSRNSENGYILRPEVIEGFFYLWRLTGKPMYREWVWDAIQAIDKYCRVEGGFSGIYDVYDPKKGHDDVQQSFFLAETLKYAYLTFTDNSVVPLDKWVFNTEAHPLPVMS
ncbi:hypothetical protein Y032_0738g1955 [Ancylostoma ceylanicum]|uniref:alpha-1,2-Mannosidase n=4 Tax=Ancylostoma ceylanicum TaxID=53326 RepID=A0A016WGP0_9BILA|nr:hypothetical protein Y032_0738g1955 [Ancylostoma ceylanicum]